MPCLELVLLQSPAPPLVLVLVGEQVSEKTIKIWKLSIRFRFVSCIKKVFRHLVFYGYASPICT